MYNTFSRRKRKLQLASIDTGLLGCHSVWKFNACLTACLRQMLTRERWQPFYLESSSSPGNRSGCERYPQHCALPKPFSYRPGESVLSKDSERRGMVQAKRSAWRTGHFCFTEVTSLQLQSHPASSSPCENAGTRICPCPQWEL